MIRKAHMKKLQEAAGNLHAAPKVDSGSQFAIMRRALDNATDDEKSALYQWRKDQGHI